MEKQKRRFGGLFQRRSKQTMQTTFARLPENIQCGLANWLTQGIMESAEIKTAINFIAEVFSTIPTYHRRTDGDGNDEYLESSIAYVLNKNPNPLQNRTQFFVSVISQLLRNSNVLVLPEWNGTQLRSIAPLPATTANPQQDETGSYYIDVDAENKRRRIKVDDVIILNKFSTLNGGGNNGALSLHQSIMQAILKRAEENAINPKTIQAYLQIRQGNMKTEAADKRRKEILDQLTNRTDGELPIVTLQGDMDLKSIDIKNIPLDKDLLEYAKKAVYNYFGLTDDVLQRKANSFEWQLFIATTIAPLANQASQEFSRKLFTARELQVGNWIEFDMTALRVNTLEAITNYMRTAIPFAVATPNEVRELIGMGNKKNGMGDNFFTTLNMIEETSATEYKLLMAKGGRPPQIQNEIGGEDENR